MREETAAGDQIDWWKSTKDYFKLLFRKSASLGWAALLVLTLVTLPCRYYWLSDLIANLRIQIVIGGVAVACLALAQRRFSILAGAMACLAIHLWYILPQVWGIAPPAVPDSKWMKVMTVNVLTENSRHDAIVRHIVESDPDVVAVLELSFALSNRPWFIYGLVIDHVMISDHFVCQGYQVGPEIGSDHRSVSVDVAMVRSRDARR